jgi:GDP-L-fucose synthase
MLERDASIYVAGHTGLVGDALIRRLRSDGFDRLVIPENRVDLREQAATERLFAERKPQYVFLSAAKVGGIRVNSEQRAEFIRDNLLIATNVVDAAYRHGVKKLLFLGSSCIYPKLAPQPIREEHLLTGPLEETNEAYAIAKIAGMLMCKSYNVQYGTNFIAAMPTNLYGPKDNFDLRTSHVLPALIRKFYEAKLDDSPSVKLWGTGTPRREFLHVDDLADALVFMMQRFDATPDEWFVNVGVGEDIPIADLADLIAREMGYRGRIEWDSSMPDGTPRKLLDVSKLRGIGWSARISLVDGVRQTIEWYRQNATPRSRR